MTIGRSHGHVIPRDDGHKARCGGPALCRECALEREVVGLRWLIEHGERAFGTQWRKASGDDIEFVRRSMAAPGATLTVESSAPLPEDSRPPEPPPCSCPTQPRTGEIVCCGHDRHGVRCRRAA